MARSGKITLHDKVEYALQTQWQTLMFDEQLIPNEMLYGHFPSESLFEQISDLR